MSPRTFGGGGNDELNRVVGEIAGQLEMMRDENKRMIDDNRRLLEKLDRVQVRVGEIDNKLEPMASVVADHKTAMAAHLSRIIALELFDGKIAAIISIIGVAAGAFGTGMWVLFTNFSSVITFARKLFGG